MNKKRQFSDKQIQKISQTILSCYEALFLLEETKHLNVFKHNTKRNLTRTLNDLMFIEKEYYDKIDKDDEAELSDKLTSNKFQFFDEFLKFDFSHYTKLQEIFVAYQLDAPRISGISDKILIEKKDAKRIKYNKRK